MTSTSRTFADWLAYIEQLHPQGIELGLERVMLVYSRMALPLTCPVITVGGTNGKGSTCTLLEAMLMAAGYRVGLYTSPHLHHFNERARIDGEPASDEALVRQFEAVEAARGDTQLTYFEFTSLAIFGLFAEAQLDVAILEVGLGGRLDAVNILDADVAVVTNVGIDHIEYLGNTRELIGFEKAGIFRRRRVAICGDYEPPASLVEHALAIRADLRVMGRDFRSEGGGDHWNWSGHSTRYDALDYPALPGANQVANATVALAALEAVQDRLPVDEEAVHAGLARATLPGRFQMLPGKPTVVLDVAHNPHAAAVLADNLDRMGQYANTYAVFGAMRDKDIDGVIECLRDRIDHWCVTDLPMARAASAAELADSLRAAGVGAGEGGTTHRTVQAFPSPADALANALSRAGENDRIAVFGSFWTVAGAIAAETNRRL